MTCRACGFEHSSLDRCEVAARKRAVNGTPVNSAAVNRAETPAVNESAKSRGAYPNTDARRAYMRDYMKRHRPAKGAQ